MTLGQTELRKEEGIDNSESYTARFLSAPRTILVAWTSGHCIFENIPSGIILNWDDTGLKYVIMSS